MITGRGKGPLEDHFDRVIELEHTLEVKGDVGKRDLLDQVRSVTDIATVHYVRQGDRAASVTPSCAPRSTSGNEPFAVLLGDDLIDERDHLLSGMIAVQERHGGSVIALIEVPPDQISLYGCAAVEATGEPDDVVQVTDLVEKPTPPTRPATTPSSAATCSHPRCSTSCATRPRAGAARSSSRTRSRTFAIALELAGAAFTA